ETWFKTGANPADGNFKPILSKQATAGDNNTATFNLQVQHDGNLNYFMGNGSTYGVQVDGGVLTADTWYHVAVSYDSGDGTTTMYVNGEAVDTDTFSGSVQTNANPIEIGHFNNGPEQFFDGQVDDVRIWDDVRTAQEIADNFQTATPENTGSNLQAQYTFDGIGADGVIADQSGNGNNITVLKGAPVDPAAAPLSFGDADIVDINSHAATLTPGGNAPFTYEAWIKLAPTEVDGGIILEIGNSSGATNTVAVMRVNAAGQPFFHAFQQPEQVTSSVAVNDGGWHHVAVSYDGTTATLVVDGTSEGSAPVTLNLGTDYAQIGRLFEGEIADVRVWDTARTVHYIS
ncbi:MAG: LamG domain-containing protein, partial [Kangiella sp.]|nr:LamG domain-containing protein [Kangiella sp.]